MLAQLHFESERLLAKRLLSKDAQNLYAIYSDHEAMKFRGSKSMEKLSDAITMIEQCDVPKKLRLGVFTKSEDVLIGTLLLVQSEISIHSYEIGFSFGKEHWGKGYAKETLAMIESKLKTHFDSLQLTAWCITENIASVSIFQKAGFAITEQTKYPQSTLFVKIINDVS